MPKASSRVRPLTMQRLSEVYGERFLAYVLNATSDELEELLAGASVLDSTGQATLRALRSRARRALSATTERFERHLLYEAVSLWVGPQRTTLANGWRVRNGGHLPQVDVADEFARHFLHLLRDVYPVLLSESEQPQSSMRSDRSDLIQGLARRHPVRAAFADKARSSELDKICSTPTNEHAVRWSTGHEVEYPVENAFDFLLSGTMDALHLRGWPLDWPELRECGLHILEQARGANVQGQCQAAVVAGIGDVRLTRDEPAVLMTDGGPTASPGSDRGPILTLCASTPEILPPPLEVSPLIERRVMAQIFWHEEVQWIPVSLVGDTAHLQLVDDAQVLSRQRARQQVLDLARLSIASVSSDWDPRAPAVLAQRLLLPFGSEGLVEILPKMRIDLFTESSGRPPGLSHERWLVVRSSEAQQIFETCRSLVNGVATPSMVSAVRRLTSARSHGDSASGQLVDLVVAVEAMFGGRSESDTRNPKSADIEKALCLAAGPGNPDDRSVVRTIFTCRHQVVHGGGRRDDADTAALEQKIEAVLPAAFDLIHRALLRIARDPDLRSCAASYERRTRLLSCTT